MARAAGCRDRGRSGVGIVQGMAVTAPERSCNLLGVRRGRGRAGSLRDRLGMAQAEEAG